MAPYRDVVDGLPSTDTLPIVLPIIAFHMPADVPIDEHMRSALLDGELAVVTSLGGLSRSLEWRQKILRFDDDLPLCLSAETRSGRVASVPEWLAGVFLSDVCPNGIDADPERPGAGFLDTFFWRRSLPAPVLDVPFRDPDCLLIRLWMGLL